MFIALRVGDLDFGKQYIHADQFLTTRDQHGVDILILGLDIRNNYISYVKTVIVAVKICAWCGGPMVNVLRSSGPGSSTGRGHCVVFLGKTLYSHSGSFHPGV